MIYKARVLKVGSKGNVLRNTFEYDRYIYKFLGHRAKKEAHWITSLSLLIKSRGAQK